MPRKQHTHHFIYKTTCTITNKFYYGMHSTSNLNDGYIGSGKRLWLSINKHGKDNHKIEILEFLPDRDSLKRREKELITEDLLKNPICMNLQLGGEGGFINEDHQLKTSSAGGKSFAEKRKNNPEKYLNVTKIRVDLGKSMYQTGIFKRKDWTGLQHKEESKKKIGFANSIHQKGSGNSQFNKIWIYNLEIKQSIKINKNELDHFLKNGWILGRKIKF